MKETRMKSELFTSCLGVKIIFGMETHVAVSPCGSPRFSFLKIAATPFGLPLLPAKSLVCSGCSLASAVATPPLHYQLFAEKGKGFFMFR